MTSTGRKGDETTRLLRNICPAAFIIGMSQEEKGQTFRQAGANAYINKNHIVQKLLFEIKNRSSQQASVFGCGKSGEADTDRASNNRGPASHFVFGNVALLRESERLGGAGVSPPTLSAHRVISLQGWKN